MRMLSFEEYIIACEDDEPKSVEEIEAQIKAENAKLKANHARIAQICDEHVKIREGNGVSTPADLPEEKRARLHEIENEVVQLNKENKAIVDRIHKLGEDLMEARRVQDEANLHRPPSTKKGEEEISKLKKYGKYGLGVAAVGGLAYGGYKLLHRNQNTSNEMLSFEEFVDVIN